MSLVVVNRRTQETFLKSRFVIFRCQKYVKKGYMEMTKKICLETLKKCPGSVYLPLLLICKISSYYSDLTKIRDGWARTKEKFSCFRLIVVFTRKTGKDFANVS